MLDILIAERGLRAMEKYADSSCYSTESTCYKN